MCLILLAWRSHAAYPLVVAANRDEFYARPSSAAGWWSDRPAILAGRDLEAGGTWMGVDRSGSFAAVTNYRGAHEPSAAHSRGALVTGFLQDGQAPAAYMDSVFAQSTSYSGFNLLVADAHELWWMSNRGGTPRRLEPGIYGLGNDLLDAPGLEPAKRRFAEAIDPLPALEPLFSALAPARIAGEQYGTRCSTVLLLGTDRRIRYAERGFSAGNVEQDTVQYEFAAAG
jgi:uncharacterized protein with NRDE domain